MRVAFPPERDSDPLCRAPREGDNSQFVAEDEYRLGLAPRRFAGSGHVGPGRVMCVFQC